MARYGLISTYNTPSLYKPQQLSGPFWPLTSGNPSFSLTTLVGIDHVIDVGVPLIESSSGSFSFRHLYVVPDQVRL
jgi:hypothetical protein